jgi:hypothetical protein
MIESNLLLFPNILSQNGKNKNGSHFKLAGKPKQNHLPGWDKL